MKILSVKTKREQTQALRAAVRVLRRGGVVVFPTETAYGLAADVKNHRAIEKVFRIKGRIRRKQLSWIVSSRAMAERYLSLTPLAKQLAARYWPGPLTLVLSRKDGKGLPAGRQGTVAVRISSHPIARALARGLGRPITATSANLSGKGGCYTVKQVYREFHSKKNKPNLILDGGNLPPRKPSTILDVTGTQLRIVRRGSIRVSTVQN